MTSVTKMMKMLGMNKPTKSANVAHRKRCKKAMSELKSLQSSLNLVKKVDYSK